MTQENSPRRTAKEAQDPYNRYYMRVSGMYRAAKWGMLLLFILYLLLTLFIRRDSITYENLLYLMRDLNISSDGGSFASAVYEEQQNMTFCAFKNELALAGSSGVRLYDGSGACVLDDSTSYKAPALESGEKYLLLYDAGGNDYALFTTLACVHRASADGAIQYADIADSGRYLIVSRTEETKYKVTLYSASFTELARYYRDSFVTSAAISPNGEAVAILSADASGWTLNGSVTLCSDGSAETKNVSLGTSLPVAARYFSDGSLAVICDDRVVFLTPSGEIAASVSYEQQTLQCFDFSDACVAFACKRNVLGSESRIVLLDTKGSVLCDEVRTGKIESVSASDVSPAVYIVSGSSVEKLSRGASERTEFSGNLRAVREVGGCAVLCYSSGAQALLANAAEN